MIKIQQTAKSNEESKHIKYKMVKATIEGSKNKACPNSPFLVASRHHNHVDIPLGTSYILCNVPE